MHYHGKGPLIGIVYGESYDNMNALLDRYLFDSKHELSDSQDERKPAQTLNSEAGHGTVRCSYGSRAMKVTMVDSCAASSRDMA